MAWRRAAGGRRCPRGDYGEFDFKGNPLEEQRQLVASKTTQPDWSALLGQSTTATMATAATSLLESETFSASSERDAVNRVLTVISPDDSELIDTYDEGGALQAVEVEHRGSRFAGRVERPPPSDRRIKRKTLRPGLP